ncbi:MAG: hypothetical protein ACD_9C00070G0007 [uncultured bacterium]|nr:MAG: hypothetical protein ACD_9C00070G0007 [uncultured bacterium]
MDIVIIVVLFFIIIAIVWVAVNLFTLPFNDFLEKVVKKTLWLWLPIHAFKRLSREIIKKYFK